MPWGIVVMLPPECYGQQPSSKPSPGKIRSHCEFCGAPFVDDDTMCAHCRSGRTVHPGHIPAPPRPLAPPPPRPGSRHYTHAARRQDSNSRVRVSAPPAPAPWVSAPLYSAPPAPAYEPPPPPPPSYDPGPSFSSGGGGNFGGGGASGEY